MPNFGNVQRLFKKEILEALVTTFPAGNSLTLVDSLVLPSCLAGDLGIIFVFSFRLRGALDDIKFMNMKQSEFN
jgi:hypothetical protein